MLEKQLTALDAGRFGNYWFATGTPAFLAEMLKVTDYDLSKLANPYTGIMLSGFSYVCRRFGEKKKYNMLQT